MGGKHTAGSANTSSGDHASTGHGSDGHDVEGWVKKYRMVGISLFILTALTVGASFLPNRGIVVTVLVALAIASVKGSLVCAYFMHLIEEKPIITYVLLITVFCVIGLFLIPTLWYLDTISY